MQRFFMMMILGVGIAFASGGCEDSRKNTNNNNANNTNNANNVNNINNTNNATCGDGRIQVPELCDGSQLGTATCQSLGYTGGTLRCGADCRTYDTSACTGEPGPYGFFIRVPQWHELQCDNGPQSFRDSDHICTFSDGAATGVIYFQATPAECVSLFSELPAYATTAWISQDGTVSTLPAAEYDFGGNHHNDSFTFTFSGKRYRYYHSSFGWGFRSCQPMDCMQKLDDRDQVTEDGCTFERTLPVVCRLIEDDGSFGELVDDFEKCPGDPNAK